jgi:hypothetical protein
MDIDNDEQTKTATKKKYTTLSTAKLVLFFTAIVQEAISFPLLTLMGPHCTNATVFQKAALTLMINQTTLRLFYINKLID